MSKKVAESIKTVNTKPKHDNPVGDQKRKMSSKDEGIDISNRVKPKKSMFPYLCYVTQNVKAYKTGEMTVGDAVKKCAQIWKTLSDKQKEPYVKLSQEDEKRHAREMKEFNQTGFFTDKEGVHSSKFPIKKKHKKAVKKSEKIADKKAEKKAAKELLPVQPKKAKVPFMFLVKDKASKIIKENGFKSAADATKVLGQLWKEMTEQEKQPYLDMSAQDAKRREKQLQELENLGYFITEDGEKSTDLPQKIKKGRVSGNSVEKKLGKREKPEAPNKPKVINKKQNKIPTGQPSVTGKKTFSQKGHKVKIVMNKRASVPSSMQDEEGDNVLEGGSSESQVSSSGCESEQEEVPQWNVQKRQKIE